MMMGLQRSLLGHMCGLLVMYYLVPCFLRFLVSIFFPLIDIVPSFVYYRAGVAVQVLVDRWESNQFERDSEKVQRIASLYDSIGNLVTRADYIFGLLIVLNHGFTFLFICILTSSLLKPMMSHKNMLLGYLVFFLVRLVWPIVFQSSLHSSSERLKAIVLSSSLQSSSKMGKNHHNNMPSTTAIANADESVKTFLFFLVNRTLTACPCGLYNIIPTIFFYNVKFPCYLHYHHFSVRVI